MVVPIENQKNIKNVLRSGATKLFGVDSLGRAAFRNVADFLTREALGEKADKENAALEGQPTAPTPNTADKSNRLATTAYVKDALAAITPVERATAEEVAEGILNDKYVTPETLKPNLPFVSKADAEVANIPAPIARTTVNGVGYKRVAEEPTHGLKYRSADRWTDEGAHDSANGGWWEIDEAVPSELSAGASADNVTDDTLAIQDLVAWAMIDPKRRKIALNGRVYCASDVPDIHKVQWEGPGSICVGAGLEFFPNPNNLNRGFGGLGYNDIFISPTGSDTASGLSDQFPVSVSRAREVLARYSPLQGLWRLRLAEGVYRDALSLWDSESGPLSLYINGPTVDTWDNTNPPPAAKSITSIGLTNPATLDIASHGLSNGDKIFVGFATKSGGAHEVDGAIYTATVVDGNSISIGVDGTGWSAYTGNGKAYPLKGSRPKAIGYGSGAGSGYWITGQNNDNIQINDVLCINWGVKNGSSANQDGGVVATGHSNVRAINVHALDNQWGVVFRDSSIGQWQSGEGSDNQKACWAIDARVTFGIANPTSTRTDTLLLQRNTWACDMWEMANGHFDGCRLVDNVTDAEVRKNAHLVFVKNEITNTGAAKNSVVANFGQFTGNEADNTWIGSFNNFIQRGQGTRIDRGATPWDWISVDRRQVAAIAANAGEVTVMSLAIPQTQMYLLGQGIRARFYNSLNVMAGTLTLRFKVGSTTLYTRVIPLSANVRGLDFEYEMHSQSFGGIRARYKELLTDEVAGTTTPYMKAVAGGTLDTRTAGVTFTVTAQFSNSGDTMGAFGFQQIDTMGW